MKPLVSIITLTYKNYDKLFETIKSVLTQNYANIEYIIADDSSGDFPKDEVERYIEENNTNNIEYKIIINDNNLGTVKNFNNAIRNSKGDYVFPLSGNDVFYNNHVVSDIIDVFIETECKMVITGRVLRENNKIKCVYPHVLDRKRVYKLDSNRKKYKALMISEDYGMYIGCNVYYDKSTLEDYGLFDEKYRLLEDLPILEKFLWNEKVELRPELISITYDAKTGVTLKRNTAHPILQKDIMLFNRTGKVTHYDELDKKTKNHINFGIKRACTDDNVHMILVYFRYTNRIITYLLYRTREKVVGLFDRKLLSDSISNK